MSPPPFRSEAKRTASAGVKTEDEWPSDFNTLANIRKTGVATSRRNAAKVMPAASARASLRRAVLEPRPVGVLMVGV
jgi:hypothetical protein